MNILFYLQVSGCNNDCTNYSYYHATWRKSYLPSLCGAQGEPYYYYYNTHASYVRMDV